MLVLEKFIEESNNGKVTKYVRLQDDSIVIVSDIEYDLNKSGQSFRMINPFR